MYIWHQVNYIIWPTNTLVSIQHHIMSAGIMKYSCPAVYNPYRTTHTKVPLCTYYAQEMYTIKWNIQVCIVTC